MSTYSRRAPDGARVVVAEFDVPRHLRGRSPAEVDPKLLEPLFDDKKTIQIRGWRKIIALAFTLGYFTGLAAFASMTSASDQILTDLGLYGLLSLGVYTGGNAGVAFAAAKSGTFKHTAKS